MRKVNRIAWAIRKQAAKRYNCALLEISWKHCLLLAYRSLVIKVPSVAAPAPAAAAMTENVAMPTAALTAAITLLSLLYLFLSIIILPTPLVVPALIGWTVSIYIAYTVATNLKNEGSHEKLN
jgi:hypothetical protein